MLTKDFLNFLPKSRFFENVVQYQVSKHFEQNRDFWKLWPELIFSENFDQNQHFRKFGRKSRCSKMKMFSHQRDFSKILTIIDILKIFCPISRLSTISTKIEIIENFDQNRDFQIFCPKPAIIPKNADKNKIFKNMAKIKIFQRTSTNIEISKTFWPKSKFSIISTRSEIFRYFFFLPKPTYLEIFTKIEMLKYVDQIQILRKYWRKSRFFDNFDQNWNFRKFLPKWSFQKT